MAFGHTDGLIRNYSITGYTLGPGLGWVSGDVEPDTFWTPAGFHYGAIMHRRLMILRKEGQRRRRMESQQMVAKAREAINCFVEMPFCILKSLERKEQRTAAEAARSITQHNRQSDPLCVTEEAREEFLKWVLGDDPMFRPMSPEEQERAGFFTYA